jgi:head-tail adaptor
MDGRVKNIGAFRDRITVSFVASQTATAQGGRTKTYTNYEVFADVRSMSNNQAQLYGIDIMSDKYTVVCRVMDTGRPARVTYNGNMYHVIAAEKDKVNQFLRMAITRNI